MKILVIDDNPDHLTTLKAIAREALPDSLVLTALDGPRGIELAYNEDPDVILLDILMPEMDGYEVCRRLKDDAQTSAIPVVFLTALQASRESRVKALEAGAEAFLVKPIDDQELVAQVRAMARLKAAHHMQRQEKEHLAELVAERTAELQQELAERKRAEESLQETKALLARTEEIGKLGGWEFDIDTRQQIWTKVVYDIHELDITFYPTVEQGINFYTPESRPIIEKAVQRAIEQNEPFDLELEIITAKGNLRAVHTIGRHDPGRGKIVGFFQDITERKQAEASRLESERRRSSEQAAALETQRQAGLTALSLMEDAVAARNHAEAMSRTLAEQLDELRRWQQATLNREGRILSVKKEINDLLAAHGEPPRYPSAVDAKSES